MFHATKLAVDHGDLNGGVEQFMDDLNGRPGSFRALPGKVRELMCDNARTLPLLFGAPPPPQITCGHLGCLSMPVTVARGSDSRAHFQIAAEGALRCIAGVRSATIPNARHLWPIEDPRGFSQLVLDWLDAA